MRQDDRLLEVIPLGDDDAPAREPILPPRRRAPRKYLVAALVVLLLAGVGLLAQGDEDRERVADPSPAMPVDQQPVATTPVVPLVPSPAWQPTTLVDPVDPEGPIPVAVPAGDVLFVWAGPAPLQVDLRTGKRAKIPAPPISDPDQRVALWTGHEIILWGDRQGAQGQALAAFDPLAHRWRLLPEAPSTAPRRPLVAAWTGRDVILWGERRGETMGPGARLNLRTGRWVDLPAPPSFFNQGNGVWTGEHLVVVGSYLDSDNRARRGTGALSYDPAADGWVELPDPPLSPQATWITRVNDVVVGWDYQLAVQRLRPDEETWVPVVKPPMRFSECYPGGVESMSGSLFAFCDQAALIGGKDLAWRSATPPATLIGLPLALPDGRLLAWTEVGPFTLDLSELTRAVASQAGEI